MMLFAPLLMVLAPEPAQYADIRGRRADGVSGADDKLAHDLHIHVGDRERRAVDVVRDGRLRHTAPLLGRLVRPEPSPVIGPPISRYPPLNDAANWFEVVVTEPLPIATESAWPGDCVVSDGVRESLLITPEQMHFTPRLCVFTNGYGSKAVSVGTISSDMEPSPQAFGPQP